MSPIVLITRPEEAAHRLARMLRQRWAPAPEIIVSPVMAVRFLAPDLPLAGVKALMFASRSGVEAFARISTRRDLPCHVVGEATQAEAERQGFSVITTGQDADGLFEMLTNPAAQGPLLHLHGDHVAGDVTGRLRASGLSVDEAVIYRQEARALTPAAIAALNGERPVLVPLFSPRSARLFFETAQGTAPLLCAAMSANVAHEVPQTRIHRLITAQTPDMQAMLDSLDDLREDAIQLEGAKPAQ